MNDVPHNGINTPILFLIFNRLETTQKVFEQIKMARPHFLYIASDGPRVSKIDEINNVNEIRKWVLDNITWDCEVKTLFRKENLGCGAAVSSAINWFFENVEMGIILEDDCFPDPSFFIFCEELLIKFKNDTRIMHIAGTNLFANDNIIKDYSYHFSKYANVWGWATWRRAWVMYDFEIKNFSIVRDKKLLKSYFNYYPAYVSRLKWYSAVFQDEFNNSTIDTWDYQWCFTCVSNSGISIVPKSNLVKNIGFDINATHTIEYDSFFSKDTSKISSPLIHPSYVMIDQKKDLQFEKRIFGSLYYTLRYIVIDFFRRYFLKRSVNYFKYL